MKVVVLTWTDTRHGGQVLGAYSSSAAALDSLPMHAERLVTYYGGSSDVEQRPPNNTYWAAGGMFSFIEVIVDDEGQGAAYKEG